MRVLSRKKSILFLLFTGIYIVFLFWVTLFQREPTSKTYIFLHFESYQKLFLGESIAFAEILVNIILFIPVGYIIKVLFKTKDINTVIIGLCISLVIETTQLFTKLGCFDVDDLINNPLGAFIGCLIYRKLPYSISFCFKKIILWIFLGMITATTVIISTKTVSSYLSYQQRVSFAALNDTDEHKNILLLDCQDKKSSDGCISLTYQDDGTVHIKGVSDAENWLKMGKIVLEPGEYIFTGFSGVDKKTVAFELEYENNGETEYLFIGENPFVEFSIEKNTEVNANVVVYNNYNCDILARPAIYKIK